MRRTILLALVLGVIGIWHCGTVYGAVICGNGIREGIEECDNGTQNSDTIANACRTNCVLPKCGDWVRDSNEQCDEGPYNNDKIPDACRKDCRTAHCGDGVLDEREECDDKNADAYDGCHECMRCYLPKDNLVLAGIDYTDVRLCPGRYEFQDQGQEGIIIINSSFTTLDCQGSTIVGVNPALQSAASRTATSRVAAVAKEGLSGSERRIGKRKDKTGKSSSDAAQGSSNQGTGNANPPSVAYANKGTGIVINNEEVVLRNCRVEGFKTGVKVKSVNAVVFDNTMCHNVTDIQADYAGNYGVKNSCSRVQNWQENGQPGCTKTCQ